MKAELQEILETDNYGDLKNYCPENPDYFSIGISMTIGVLGQTGGDYFDS